MCECNCDGLDYELHKANTKLKRVKGFLSKILKGKSLIEELTGCTMLEAMEFRKEL